MRFKNLLLWDMKFQVRYGFYLLYGILTAIYVVLLLSMPRSWKEDAATMLVYSDPAAMGLFFMGAIILLEKSQRVTSFLAVSPIRVFEYVCSKVLSLSLIGIFVAVVLTSVANHRSLLPVLSGTFLSSVLFTLSGMIIATKITSLNQFILATVPVEIITFVPAVLHLFDIIPDSLRIYPGNVCIDLIAGRAFSGTAIRFGVPFAEKVLVQITDLPVVLSPYYGLFDIFFASLSPAMFCFIAAMVVLEEHDDHIDRYLFVTDLGRNGYFISRIVLPAFFASVITVMLLPAVKLTELTGVEIMFLSLTGSLQGIVIALLIVTLSSNKLEGMAVTKLSSLMMLGAVAPYFVPEPLNLCISFLPSFWMGKAVAEKNRLLY